MTYKETIKSLHEQGLTCKQIAKQLNKKLSTIRYHLKQLNLTPNLDKRWFSQEEHYLNKLQKQFILGSLLGDLSLRKQAKNAKLCLVHSFKQKELFLSKVQILGEFMGEYKECSQFDKRTNKTYIQYRGDSKSHPEFTEIYNILYKDGVKTITQEYLDLINDPIALAYWFMDDGTSRGTFATNCFSEPEIDLLISWLSSKWNIIATKQKNLKQFVIHISAKSRKYFEDLIVSYIIPEMRYKLIYY